MSVINPRNYGIDFYSDILFTPRHRSAQSGAGGTFSCSQPQGMALCPHPPEGSHRPAAHGYGVNRSQAHMEYELQMSKEMIQPLYVEIGYMNRIASLTSCSSWWR